jgi:hypothetical protein
MADDPKRPYKNSSYKAMLGGEVVPPVDEGSDPWGGKVPNDKKDYAVYQQFWLDQWYNMTKGSGILKVSSTCEDFDEKGNPRALRRVKKEHIGNSIIFACNHVIWNDPINPWPVVCIPFRRGEPFCFFLCKTCYRLFEEKRLKLYDNINFKCGCCVAEAVTKLKQKDPSRFQDFRLVKA